MLKKRDDLDSLFISRCSDPAICHEDVRRLMHNNVNGIIIVDNAKVILYANRAAERIFGTAAAELVGIRINFDPDVGKAGEITIQANKGHNAVVEVSAMDLQWGEKPAWLISLQDITERKRYEEQLQNNERQLAEAQKIAHLGSWKRYIDTGKSFWSDEMYRILGLDPASAQPSFERFMTMVHPEDRDEVLRLARQALEKGKSFNSYYCRIIRPDGSIRILLGEGEVIADPAGNPFMVIGTALDVTERKLMEEEIQNLNGALEKRAAELEAANRELESFSYTVCHDLRSPLTNINGYCQVLTELCSQQLDEQCRGYLQEISRGTERMNQLIETLLKFSMVTRDKLELESVDLSRIAFETASELQLGQPERKAEFKIREGLTATGDERLLRVALFNLLGNAWKFTGIRETAVIEFGLAENNDQTFFIRDNGIGFSESDADRLFIPFQRLQETEEISGHGIGLATVQRIIERHGGRVWAKGEPGKGATFFFSL